VVIDLDEVSAAGATRELHGPTLSSDGKFLFFSELHANKLRVFDTELGDFVQEISHAVLKGPHGVYPNPSHTRAMSTQYSIGGGEVSIWNLDAATGQLTFDKAIALSDNGVLGAYTHTGAWIDDDRFYTQASEDATLPEMQGGVAGSQPSVWLVNAATGTAKAVLSKDGGQVTEGVSDCRIANGKLYVGEGNVVLGVPPGYFSAWDISNPEAPTLVKRMSAGDGLPADFLDGHEVMRSPDGSSVFLQSFRSSHLVQVDTATDNVVRVWNKTDDGMSLPHGMYIQ
jgi:hypothetical protein